MSDRPLPSSFDENEDFYNESGFQKVLRRLKQEPLVPIGCLLTVAAFTNAYRAMRKGDHAGVQRMFRARVAAQAFTVVAMVAGGLYFSSERHRERELWKVQQQTEAEEKRQRWIHELEARDEEDKALRERLERRRKRAAERGVAGAETVSGGAGGVSEAVSAAVARSKPKAKGREEAENAGLEESKPVSRAESGDETGSAEKKEGTNFFGSLGGLFGRSTSTAKDAESETESRKVDAETGKK